MPDDGKNNNILRRYQVSTRKPDRKRKKLKRQMRNKTSTNIMRSGRTPSPEGKSLRFGGTVSPMMCPADGQQKEDEDGLTS